jgi:hypothetical protein
MQRQDRSSWRSRSRERLKSGKRYGAATRDNDRQDYRAHITSAVSSLKCNTGLQAHDFSRKDFGWRFKAKTLTRAVV